MGKSFDGLLREMKMDEAEQFAKDFSMTALFQKKAFEEYKNVGFTEQQAIRLTAELIKQPGNDDQQGG